MHSETKSSELRKKTLLVGLVLTILMAICCAVLSFRFLGNPRIDQSHMYHVGMDVLGVCVCAVLYYGCMWQAEETSRSFIALVILTSFGFFCNEVIWFVAETPALRFMLLSCWELSKFLNLAMIYLFFRYVYATLAFEGKLARFADKLSPILFVVSILIVLISVFTPFTFSVNDAGVYAKTSWGWLEDVYLVVLASIAAVLIVRCGSPLRQKTAALSFILIPILVYLITGGADGYATQYGSVLLSLILMYCILFNDRSSKLAATQSELKMANQIQASMLPSIFPPFPDRPDFDVYASMDPAKEVGGDFYDFFLIDETHLGLVMADVSGKGVPAALFMMISKILVQNYAMTGFSPAQVLQAVNKQICANNHEEMFVTVWFGVLDTETGKITAANAGHEYPVLRHANGQFELIKDKHGLVIGAMDGVRYKEYELTLSKGSKLFLYTDGVPEATNAKNELFGTDRMLAALNQDPSAAPEQVLRNVRKAVDGFVLDAAQFDDLTMLCLEFKGNTSMADN